jgi:phosphoribosyl-AMP cyclohydrolase
MDNQLIDELKFDDKGLIPAVVQDYSSNDVLMMAYMNKESLKKTLDTGIAHYWSRSRGKLWKKGETSGHFQYVKSINIDCDGDTLLLKVVQQGVACHTGNYTCFYRKLAPMFSNISSSSTSLAIVTPSLVIAGEPNFFSRTTFLPFGPSVIFTVSASWLTPLSRARLASSPYLISFAII